MNLDVRLPIGYMFSLFGVILTLFGAATQGNAIYAHSLGWNVNLIWGVVLLVFGALMLGLAWRGRLKQRADEEKPAGG